MKTKPITLLLLTGLIANGANAITCEVISHERNRHYEISAALNHYTHIILPENIKRGTDAIVGNPDLWKTDVAGPHIYIKPTTEQKLGTTVSLSVVGDSGTSYDFIVNRVSDLKTPCYSVQQGLLFNDDSRSALSLGNRDPSSDVADLWRERYEALNGEQQKSTREAVLNALRRYRYQIYTRYDWNRGGGFIGKNLISDVYDDGRFTYIRVHDQNKGLMMVEAELSGQVEIIEASYDSINKMYTVSGIFPEFTLKYGSTKIKIARADNSTKGDY